MRQYFPGKREFNSLSITDLLEAREAYHSHLAHIDSVLATAIGRYRIRTDDSNARTPGHSATEKFRSSKLAREPRTLRNSVVTPWSWPCVLVFVDRWVAPDGFGAYPEEMVPPRLYLPDGRVVPTCVIMVEQGAAPPSGAKRLNFPTSLVGGGYLLLTEDQGEEHIGSVGCLVSDGNAMYALTNRHVAGVPGKPVMSLIAGREENVGTSFDLSVNKIPFDKAYPGWNAKHAVVAIDAGLIRVDDVNRWTTQCYGIGEMGDPIDLNVDTITLDLIGCPVRAYGGASGEMSGEIQALFYRYKSMGGVEYIADLMIGARPGEPPPATMPGDSGTVWFHDPPESDSASSRDYPRPIALQWGGHYFRAGANNGTKQYPFALATCLSTVCRELDIDVVCDWNTGHDQYWGKVGHFKIGATACGILSNKKLSSLMMNNLPNIGFDDSVISKGKGIPVHKSDPFMPLADVPDYVWRDVRRGKQADHFADMDQEGTGEFKGNTLLTLCAKSDANVSPEVWNKFYDSIGVTPAARGALPFRVWEIYNHMVEALRQTNVLEFVASAGIIAHFVGDACQPLHISYLHHGHEDKKEEHPVHSVYEEQMLEVNAAAMITGIKKALSDSPSRAKPAVRGGQGAAIHVVALMQQTIATLEPERIIASFDNYLKSRDLHGMWADLGDDTVKNMTAGCVCLAEIWESAWKEGNGDAIADNQLTAQDQGKLKQLYMDKSFLPDFKLPDLNGMPVGQLFMAGAGIPEGTGVASRAGKTARHGGKKQRKQKTKTRQR